MDKGQAILEAIMADALVAARASAAKAAQGDAQSRGEVFAYHDFLAVAKQQAELMGLEFADRTLTSLDPDELLRSARAKAAA